MLVSCKRWELTNGISANAVRHEYDQSFHGEISRKNVMFVLEFDICHRMSPLRMFVLHHIELRFQVLIFSCCAFPIKICNDSGCPRKICLDSHCLRRRVALVGMLHSNWLLIYFTANSLHNLLLFPSSLSLISFRLRCPVTCRLLFSLYALVDLIIVTII